MENNFNLQEHIARGVEKIVADTLKATLRDPRESAFMVKFAAAAGRGFFHINSHGGAEPCPFSPYSDVNVRDLGVRGALQSPLFMALREGGVMPNEHVGGCVLYEQRELVENILTNRVYKYQRG